MKSQSKSAQISSDSEIFKFWFSAEIPYLKYSEPERFSSLPEIFKTALFQLWVALKTRNFRAQHQRWTALNQCWVFLNQSWFRSDFFETALKHWILRGKNQLRTALFEHWFSPKQSWWPLKSSETTLISPDFIWDSAEQPWVLIFSILVLTNFFSAFFTENFNLMLSEIEILFFFSKN